MASAVEHDLDVRRLGTADPVAAALLRAYAEELEERSIRRPPTGAETVESEYEEPHGSFVVLYDAGRPIGCGGIRALGDGAAEVKRMYVVPEARRRGVGRSLLLALEDHARSMGFAAVRLDCARHNWPSYQAAGYVEIDDYNDNPFADHWAEKQLS
jgi:GNAT superfamily N-acetyltransferase